MTSYTNDIYGLDKYIEEGDIFIGKQYSSEMNHKGDSYIGEFLNGIKHGSGTIHYKSGDQYEGEWYYNQKHGQGVYKFSSGIIYIGKWENNMFIKGTIKWPDGRIYNGEYGPGNIGRHGYGTFTKINKLCHDEYTKVSSFIGTYSGQWGNDKRNGTGRMLWEDGITYEGCWKDNKMSGKGTLIVPNKDTYVGDFCDGKKHGKGTIGYSNKIIFEGEWNKGKKHGKGILTWPNGEKFIGEWMNCK